MKILYLGGETAGMIGLLTLLAKGHRPDVIAYSSDLFPLLSSVRCWGQRIAEVEPIGYDVLISVHGREIVPADFLKELSLGGINLHPCLSFFKGARPIKRALEAGETRFSVGAHKMTEVVDGGEVLVEKFIEIPGASAYNEAEIYQRLYPLYVEVLSEVLEKIA